MRQASTVTITEGEQVRTFSTAEFLAVMRSANFVGAFAFWRALDRLAEPEVLVCFHARGVLTELARRSFQDCGGTALSEQHAEALRHFGFEPTPVQGQAN
jgi:hypothetical protein